MKFSKRILVVAAANLFLYSPLYAQVSKVETPSDSQIADIVRTINLSEVKAGEVARKSKSKIVSSFAEHMITAHSNSNTEIEKLEKNIGIARRNSPAGEKIKIDSGNEVVALEKLSGTEFDHKYIAHQIEDHAEVLKIFDQTLIPYAKDLQLKSLLIQTRAVVSSHLEQAKKVQSEIH